MNKYSFIIETVLFKNLWLAQKNFLNLQIVK